MKFPVDGRIVLYGLKCITKQLRLLIIIHDANEHPALMTSKIKIPFQRSCEVGKNSSKTLCYARKLSVQKSLLHYESKEF